jgi:hypothetical protein
MTSGSRKDDVDIPVEIDFSGGTRGKFYRSDARLDLPLYLAPDLQADLITITEAQGVTLSDIANDMLRKGIAILKVGK